MEGFSSGSPESADLLSVDELAEKYNVSKSLFDGLFNTKDRQFVLELERSLLQFIDSNVNSYRLSPMNSYCRLLAHQIADYHGLKHILATNGSSVAVFKTFDDEKREPRPRLADLPIPNGVLNAKYRSGYRKSFKNNYGQRNTQQVPNMVPIPQYMIPPGYRPYGYEENMYPMKIMKREEKDFGEKIGSGRKAINDNNSNDDNDTDHKSEGSLENERASKEALYNETKERIYNEASEEESSQGETESSDEEQSTSPKAHKRQPRHHNRKYNNRNHNQNINGSPNQNYMNYYMNQNRYKYAPQPMMPYNMVPPGSKYGRLMPPAYFIPPSMGPGFLHVKYQYNNIPKGYPMMPMPFGPMPPLLPGYPVDNGMMIMEGGPMEDYLGQRVGDDIGDDEESQVSKTSESVSDINALENDLEKVIISDGKYVKHIRDVI